MKFDDLVRLFGNRAWFDFEMVLLLSGEEAECVHTELYRWRQSGKLVELRRGLFTLAEPWRHGGLDGAALAGPLYAPSYLSGLWVLARCGIVETVGDAGAGLAAAGRLEFTSVTARPARTFENAFGRFSYATFPRDLLFGSRTEELGGRQARVAWPEKALLDFWFVEGGEWDEGRFEKAGMDPGPMDLVRLGEMAARAGRPRLARAAGAFMNFAGRRGAVAAEAHP